MHQAGGATVPRGVQRRVDRIVVFVSKTAPPGNSMRRVIFPTRSEIVTSANGAATGSGNPWMRT